MNVGRLKNKVRNQAAVITQLQESTEASKRKIISYMESATMYKSENEDLRVRCEKLEEMLRLEEANSEVLRVDAEQYQDTIRNLQIAKQESEEEKSKYFHALIKNREQCRELESRLDYFKEAYKNASLEIDELKQPIHKKLIKKLFS